MKKRYIALTMIIIVFLIVVISNKVIQTDPPLFIPSIDRSATTTIIIPTTLTPTISPSPTSTIEPVNEVTIIDSENINEENSQPASVQTKNLHLTSAIATNNEVEDQLILFSDNDGNMRLTSFDGTINKTILNNHIGYPISSNGMILQGISSYSGSEVGETLNLFAAAHNIYKYTGNISPNEKWFASFDLVCQGESIKITEIQTDNTICIPPNIPEFTGEDFTFDIVTKLRWSNDEKYLAYLRTTVINHGSGETPPWDVLPTNGLYIIDTTCFENPETCSDKTSFIYSPYKITYDNRWVFSPDNQYVVVNNAVEFLIFDLAKENITKTKLISDDEYYTWPRNIAVSPDNQWIAYSTNDQNIRIQSFNGYEGKEIISEQDHFTVLGWLTAPYLKPGDSFKVLPAGDHVYIREKPDLDAAEITFLISGNTFTVLNGPVQEDGYTWWYVESDVDGTKGWISEFYGWYEKIEGTE